MTTPALPGFNLQMNDEDCVRDFLASLSDFFENFVNDPFNFSDWLEQSGRINKEFFKPAWEEAKEYLNKALSYFDFYKAEGTLLKKLEDIGFTKNNLKSKGKIFNALCAKLRQYIEKVNHEGKDLFSFLFKTSSISKNVRYAFFSSPFFILFKDVLSYLNNLLGSLVKAIPPLEVVKEFKEQIEAIMDLNKEVLGA